MRGPAGLVFAILLLAGCTGHPDAAAPRSGPETTFASDQARLEGLVTDTELVPLPEANVTLKGATSATLASDASGRFRFDDVAPGQYTLNVTHAGYNGKDQFVQLESGTIRQVRVLLAAVPRIESYQDTFQMNAFMSAGASLPLYTLRPGVYLNDKLTFHHDAKAHVLGIVTSMVWTSSAPLTAKKMRLDVIVDDTLYNQSQGKSPLLNRVEGLRQKDPGVATYEVWLPMSCDYNTWGTCVANPPDSLAVVVVQQGLTLYSSLFYGLPPPPGFTGVP